MKIVFVIKLINEADLAIFSRGCSLPSTDFKSSKRIFSDFSDFFRFFRIFFRIFRIFLDFFGFFLDFFLDFSGFF